MINNISSIRGQRGLQKMFAALFFCREPFKGSRCGLSFQSLTALHQQEPKGKPNAVGHGKFTNVVVLFSKFSFSSTYLKQTCYDVGNYLGQCIT